MKNSIKILTCFLMLVILACNNNNNNKLPKIAQIRYDTTDFIKNDGFCILAYNLKDELISFTKYDSLKKISYIHQYYKRGYVTTKFYPQCKEIHELYYLDSNNLDSIYLNNVFVLTYSGDTLCDSSNYYSISSFKEIIDSSTNFDFMVNIPCSYYYPKNVIHEVYLTITNNIDYFRVHEYTSLTRQFEIKLGKFKKGKYRIYGTITENRVIGSMPKGDKNVMTDARYEFYIDRNFTVNY